MRRIVTLLLVTAVAIVAAAVAFAAQSPRAVRASIVAAALAQKSVHWTSTFTGHGIFTSTADVNADSGSQQYTYNSGQTGTVQTLLVNDTAYVQGDAVGLERTLGLTEAQATQYAGQWISIPKGDPLYAGTAEGLTLASIVHDVTPRGKLMVFRTKSHGTRLLGVRATSEKGFFHSSLAAHARGKRLPVAFSTVGMATSLRGRFSKWNEPVNVQAPTSSTPIATVRGS